MKRWAYTICAVICMLLASYHSYSQSNQTVPNGGTTAPVNFPSGGCIYNWTNSNPSIGLPASGAGNIPSFTTANNSGSPIIATITATPVQTGFAYIANDGYGVNTVSVIDIATGMVVTTIPVGYNPYCVAVNHKGTTVYVGNNNPGISVINTATNSVSSTIPLNGSPTGMVVSPDDSKLYVANYPYVTVINTNTNSIITNINKPDNIEATDLVISPDGNTLYISNSGNNDILAMNTVNYSTVADFTAGYNPFGITLSPDGSLLYAVTSVQNNLVVINTTNGALVATIPVGQQPVNVVLNSDGSRAYVANETSNTISVINTINNSLVSTIPVGSGPIGLSLTSDGSELFVANNNSNNVSVINTTTNTVVASIKTGANPVCFGNFITPGLNCSGPITFTITINSGPTPVVTTSTVTGTILGCQGSPSSSPNVGQFTVAGTALTGDITVTPPAGFDVSLTAVGGYSPSLLLKQTGGAVISTIIYVRSSASDPVGPISGNVQITTPGASPDLVAVSGVVNALPAANPIQNLVYNNGDATTPINFTGMGNTFTYTNNNTAIGFPASGQGDISSFTATNTGNTPLIATFTVTPSYSAIAYIVNSRSSDVTLRGTPAIFPAISPPIINLGQGPWGVSLSPDYSKVYITNSNSGTVSVINTSTNIVTATVNVGSVPEGVLVSRDGSSVYVANEGSGTISVINTSSNLVTTTIPVGNSPTQLAASPDGKTIYVSNHNAQGTISVINTASNAVRATIASVINPTGMAVSPDGSKLYVASDTQNTITVINTGNYSVIATIPVGSGSTGMAITPDGSQLFVSNSGTYSVSVINTATNTVSNTVGVGKNPSGICVSPDGSFVCVADGGNDDDVCFINTSTYAVICGAYGYPPGAADNPLSFGNFIMPAAPCTGAPITFTITVNPSPPSIKAGPASGTVSACMGTPSISPNIEQFTVSGSGLTGDIMTTAPAGFEISFVPGSGYSNSLTIPQVGGTVNKITIYVRSSASAAGTIPGNAISGNITLSSPGATDQTVAVTGTVYAGPTMDQPASQTVTAGQATAPVNFTGNAGFYNWTNDTPGIGLPANGMGNIPSFTANDPGAGPTIATITVMPQSMSATACNGTPTTFTITVNPAPTSFAASVDLKGLVTVYGTASASESFTISGTNLKAGVLVTPPSGFEVSTDNVSFSSAVTVGSVGNITSAPVYVRLAATTPAGNAYTGNIALSASGTTNVDINMPNSVVNKAPLSITANNQSKPQGAPNPELTLTYTGFVNGDGPDQLTTQPVVTTTATAGSAVGQYTITVNGAMSPNYNITFVQGTLTVTPSLQYVTIPNAFTPNGDGVNDYWNIPQLAYYPNCLVSIYTRYGNLVFQSRGYAKPWDGTMNGAQVPVGAYYYIIDPQQNGIGLLSGFVAVLR